MIDNSILPNRIAGLAQLAGNYWWCWNHEARRLFEAADAASWEQFAHNPIVLLRQLSDARLAVLSQEDSFLRQYDDVMSAFSKYMQDPVVDVGPAGNLVAYFSMEYGIHASLPIYAGGLGVLSGDYLKEASDLGFPLIGIGLLYREGYFEQTLSADGQQLARAEQLQPEDLALDQVRGEDGQLVTVSLEFPERTVQAQLWQAQVGRVPLLLLDTDLEANREDDRALTSRLYPADLDWRLSQEIVLGVGGAKALRRLGYEPTLWHMNEGHAAFLSLDRIRQAMRGGQGFSDAVNATRESTVFTTHTPVPAGHDVFPEQMINRYFKPMQRQMELDQESFQELGHDGAPDGFSMSALAIQTARNLNGVSKLHGEITREMWSGLWSSTGRDARSIGYVTNGVHTSTWLGEPMKRLFDRYFGSDWLANIDDPSIWVKVREIPEQELWQAHLEQKHRLLSGIADIAQAKRVKRLDAIASFDPHALTIGFARRFTGYKRPTLILRQLDRLQKILDRGVQILFAGKAHPADEKGIRLIRELYAASQRPEFSGRLFVLEGYDLRLAKLLVQGADVWLNTPRPPNEASGTSGQKAAINGVLNCSVLDGWWIEGFNGRNGWALEAHEPSEIDDDQDAEALYEVLEQQIVPAFPRSSEEHGPPVDWIRMMKESIRTLGPQFSTRRMLRDYIREIYTSDEQ